MINEIIDFAQNFDVLWQSKQSVNILKEKKSEKKKWQIISKINV